MCFSSASTSVQTVKMFCVLIPVEQWNACVQGQERGQAAPMLQLQPPPVQDFAAFGSPPASIQEPRRLTLSFFIAMSGEYLASLNILLPWKFDPVEMIQMQGICLQGFQVANGMTMPLYQFLAPDVRGDAGSTIPMMDLCLMNLAFSTDSTDTVDIYLVATLPKLRNLRALMNPIEMTPLLLACGSVCKVGRVNNNSGKDRRPHSIEKQKRKYIYIIIYLFPGKFSCVFPHFDVWRFCY